MKMPANLCELERTGNGVDERTLQLAFELSMLGLDHGTPGTMVPSSITDDNLDVALTNHVGFTSSIIEEAARNKKSQNMTECVPVPSSEHVAEIVGRQGEYQINYLKPKVPFVIQCPKKYQLVHVRPSASWQVPPNHPYSFLISRSLLIVQIKSTNVSSRN